MKHSYIILLFVLLMSSCGAVHNPDVLSKADQIQQLIQNETLKDENTVENDLKNIYNIQTIPVYSFSLNEYGLLVEYNEEKFVLVLNSSNYVENADFNTNEWAVEFPNESL